MRHLSLALLMAAVAATGLQWGTFVAGGSDSYCYAYQAERWASGRLHVVDPLVLVAPWPDPAAAFVPAGHLPSTVVYGALAPICPAGLSMVMAPFRLLGGRDAIFLVVPLFGALLVAATYVAGARYGARVGVASALLVAASPIALYQLVQPMSDVPAAALWMTAIAAATATKPRAPILAGVAAAIAILMRPNLVAIGVPIGLFLLFRPERSWSARGKAAGLYAAGAAIGCIAVAVIQNTLYGSPFNSGYGSLDALFGIDHIGPNAARYAAWMTHTHTAAWLLAVTAPVVLPGALSLLYAGVIVVTLALYLPYVVFDSWAFLRFLLPAVPLVLILMLAVVDAAVRRAKPAWAGAVVTLVTAVLAVLFLRAAVEGGVFRLHLLESRYARAGLFADRRLPANALVVTGWQSGSVRFYSGRPTLGWGGIEPEWLDRAIAFARSRGHEPFLLFESWEEPLFRERFAAASATGRLDWPPMAEIAGGVRIYRPQDRDRYFRGEALPLEYVR